MEWDEIGRSCSRDAEWQARRSDGGPRVAGGCAAHVLLPCFWVIGTHHTVRWYSGIRRVWTAAATVDRCPGRHMRRRRRRRWSRSSRRGELMARTRFEDFDTSLQQRDPRGRVSGESIHETEGFGAALLGEEDGAVAMHLGPPRWWRWCPRPQRSSPRAYRDISR